MVLHCDFPFQKLEFLFIYLSVSYQQISQYKLSVNRSGTCGPHYHWLSFLVFNWQCLWQRCPTPALLPGESHERGSLVGCSPWGCKEWDMTERLPFHFSLSCIGEGNGNPLQCSCLENPRDRGAWRAAVYGGAQSQTRLKWLSSSSSSSMASFTILNNCNPIALDLK